MHMCSKDVNWDLGILIDLVYGYSSLLPNIRFPDDIDVSLLEQNMMMCTVRGARVCQEGSRLTL